MPTAALRLCAAPGCQARVRAGRCAAHRVQAEQQRRHLDVRKLYRTPRWAALRQQVWRANPLCVECAKAGRVEPWTDLDHIVPHRGDLRLFWDVRNLQGLCASHHAAKTAGGA